MGFFLRIFIFYFFGGRRCDCVCGCVGVVLAVDGEAVYVSSVGI